MPRARRFTPVTEWMNERQLLGLRGERLALAYLTSCGWAIEGHRFRAGHHDVDLVVRKGGLVAFVEVKTRRSSSCGTGLEAVSRLKQRHLQRVAACWALRHGRAGDQYRFDLIAVEERAGAPQIEHVEDAWRPEPLGW
jgi:putative endonuclease